LIGTSPGELHMEDELGYSGVEDILERSLGDEELEPDEAAELQGFLNREVPHLYGPQDSYVVLGSYDGDYIKNTSAAQNELSKRPGTYAFLVADLPNIDIRNSLPAFRIKFHLICEHVDYIVGVYEDNVGGEIGELGKISELYLTKTHILARKYEKDEPYSAPTRDDIRVFDLNGRCYWWMDEKELRRKVGEIP